MLMYFQVAFQLQIINTSSEVNLLHLSVTKLYLPGTRLFPCLQIFTVIYICQVIFLNLPQRAEMNATSQYRAAVQFSQGRWNLQAFCIHEMKGYSAPLFHLCQIINCCWTKQNKACTVANNYSVILWTLSESQGVLEESEAVIFHGRFPDDITFYYSVIPMNNDSVKPCM